MAKKIKDPGAINQNTYDDSSKTRRTGNAGIYLSPQGAMGTAAKRVGAARSVLLYNPTGAAIFVSSGDQSMAAPLTAADGIPVMANSTYMLNSGEDEWIRASAAGLFFYLDEEQ